MKYTLEELIAMYPGCSVNEDSGYVVDINGIIHCSSNCNNFVASYDGCTSGEMYEDFSATLMGY